MFHFEQLPKRVTPTRFEVESVDFEGDCDPIGGKPARPHAAQHRPTRLQVARLGSLGSRVVVRPAACGVGITDQYFPVLDPATGIATACAIGIAGPAAPACCG